MASRRPSEELAALDARFQVKAFLGRGIGFLSEFRKPLRRQVPQCGRLRIGQEGSSPCVIGGALPAFGQVRLDRSRLLRRQLPVAELAHLIDDVRSSVGRFRWQAHVPSGCSG